MANPDEERSLRFYERHLRDLRDIDMEQKVNELRTDVLGPPNTDGVHLVAVVEFSDDASEDGWSMVGNHLRGSVCAAGEKLGFDRRAVDVLGTWGSEIVGILPDGTRVAAIARQIRGTPTWFRESRTPTAQERAQWVGLVS